MNNLIETDILARILNMIAREEFLSTRRNRIEALHARELVRRKLARYQGTTLVITERGRKFLNGADNHDVTTNDESTEALNNANLPDDQQSA